MYSSEKTVKDIAAFIIANSETVDGNFSRPNAVNSLTSVLGDIVGGALLALAVNVKPDNIWKTQQVMHELTVWYEQSVASLEAIENNALL
jgi:hypothetical protein